MKSTNFGFSLKSLTDLALVGDEIVITVHHGIFHGDDVSAVAMLKLIAAAWGYKVRVVRTRDPAKFEGVVVDVGEGVYDHHGARAGLDKDGIPYTGFSRVLDYFIAQNNLEDSLPHRLFKEKFSDPMSEQDNGVPLRPGEVNLVSYINTFNPGYGDTDKTDEAFEDAVDTTCSVIMAAWAHAQADAKAAVALEEIVRQAGHRDIVECPPGIPWTKALVPTQCKFVIVDAPDGTVYAICVPSSIEDRFSKKKAFPKEWWGTRDQEFQKLCGLSSAIFCHVNGFICGFKTKEDAIKAAEIALMD